MRTTATKTIGVPIETVWAVLSDHEGMATWAPGLSVQLVEKGHGDPAGLGAVRRIKTRLPLAPIVEEVIAFEANERLSYKALSGVPMKNYWGDVELSRANQGTKIRYSVNADLRIPGVEHMAARLIATALLSGLAGACKRAAAKS